MKSNLMRIARIAAAIGLAASATGACGASTLRVGPGEAYAEPSAAIAAAHDGDLIQIRSDGNYDNDVTLIKRNNLTIEGVGTTRPVMKTDGRVYGKKGIWMFASGCSNLTVENIEFKGARVSDADGANGAGLRSQGQNLTVRNCRFHDNQDGILGGFGTTTIERCEFDHNGLNGLTHNLYIGDQSGTLIFRFNYSHDTVAGHLLKSRAAVNIIEFNWLVDMDGTGSYELDLPNGGKADVVGNIIQQSAGSQNSTIFAYGEEGITNKNSELNIVNNTFVNDRSAGVFVNAQNLPVKFKLLARNNIFAGPGTTIVMSTGVPDVGGNLNTTVEKAGFANPARYDFRLTKNSPAIGMGIAPGVDLEGKPLNALFQCSAPMTEKPRPPEGKPDTGAEAYLP
jgi:hypothetical protein